MGWLPAGVSCVNLHTSMAERKQTGSERDGSPVPSRGEGYCNRSDSSSQEDVCGLDGRQNSEESLGFSDSSEELCPLIPPGGRGGRAEGEERTANGVDSGRPVEETQAGLELGGPREEGEGEQAESGGGSNSQRRPSRRERKISVAAEHESAVKVHRHTHTQTERETER